MIAITKMRNAAANQRRGGSTAPGMPPYRPVLDTMPPFGRAPAGVERAERRCSSLRMGSISMADLIGIAILIWCNQALTNAAVPKVRSNALKRP